VWTVFGSILVIPLFTAFNPLALLYAILSLTLIRMLPVALALRGTHFRPDTKIVMGWLGPRGLASVVFTIIAFESFTEMALPYETLFAIAGWTIFLSFLLHGFSALPLAAWYSNRLKTASPDLPELLDVPDLESPEWACPDLVDTKNVAKYTKSGAEGWQRETIGSIRKRSSWKHWHC